MSKGLGRWIDRPECTDQQQSLIDRVRDAKVVIEYEKVSRMATLACETGREAEKVLSKISEAVNVNDLEAFQGWVAGYCSLVDRWVRLVRLPSCPKSEGEGLRRIIAVSGARASNMSTRLEGMIVPATPVTPAAAEPVAPTPAEPAQVPSVVQS